MGVVSVKEPGRRHTQRQRYHTITWSTFWAKKAMLCSKEEARARARVRVRVRVRVLVRVCVCVCVRACVYFFALKCKLTPAAQSKAVFVFDTTRDYDAMVLASMLYSHTSTMVPWSKDLPAPRPS